MHNRHIAATREPQATAPKTFAERDAWMRAILAAHGLPPLVRLVAVRLALHLHVNSGRCEPGYAIMASELGISERSVIRMVAMLERTGWLTVTRGQGWHHANRFVLHRGDKAVSPLRGDKAVSPQKATGVTESTDRGDRALSPRGVTHAVTHKAYLRERREKRRKSQTLAPGVAAQEKRGGRQTTNNYDSTVAIKERPAKPQPETKTTVLSPLFLLPPSGALASVSRSAQEPPARPQPESTTETVAAFERFWATYPRKVAQEAARKTFERAIEGGADPETIIAGAARFAVVRAGEPERYTPYPARWLQDGRWKDAPPTGAVIDQDGELVAVEEEPQRFERRLTPLEMALAMDGGW